MEQYVMKWLKILILIFTRNIDLYKEFNLLSSQQLEKLNALDLFFDHRSGEKSPDFWDDFSLETNQEWEMVRQMAKDILKLFGMEDLRLEIKKEEKFEMTNLGQKIIIQFTKIRLIN